MHETIIVMLQNEDIVQDNTEQIYVPCRWTSEPIATVSYVNMVNEIEHTNIVKMVMACYQQGFTIVLELVH